MQGYDADHEDIKRAATTNVTELSALCAATEGCAGFNTEGWLKASLASINADAKLDLYAAVDGTAVVCKGRRFCVWFFLVGGGENKEKVVDIIPSHKQIPAK